MDGSASKVIYPEFKLETYLAAREFSAPYNFCSSDIEAFSMKEIVQMADPESRMLWEELQLGYTETEGHPRLREEISKEYGDHIGKDEILCFAGAEEGIYTAVRTLLEPTDHVLVITPCYQSLQSLPTAICTTSEVPLRHEEEWELDLDKVRKAIRPNTKLIMINFPHNPTGALLTHEKQAGLVELAREKGIWIFSDEVYRLIEVDAKDRLPPIASIYEKGLSLSVLSKAFGLAGLRIGWIASQNKEVLKRMNETKHYLSICNSAPSEILALIALRQSEKIHHRNRLLMQENLRLLDRLFDDYSDWFEWVRPKGGCIGYPLLKKAIPVDEFAETLLKEAGVLILPGSVYDDKQNHFRVSFGRKSIPEAVTRLIQFIEKRAG